MALRPNVGHGLLILEVSRSHTSTHHSRYDSSGRVISSLQRLLPDYTQHLQQTNIHDPSWIRTHGLNRLAAADLRLRPRGHWDLHNVGIRNFLMLQCYRWRYSEKGAVSLLTLRLLMSYIYGAPILDVSRSHTTTQHSR